MLRGKENNPGLIRPSNIQDQETRAAKGVKENHRSHRRALESINQNIIGSDPRMVMKNNNLSMSGANEGQLSIEEMNETTALALPSNSLEDTISTMEEGKEDSDPMIEEETDDMEEVEMEDAEEEIPNIDADDRENPQAVVEYVDDIYAFYKGTENLSCVLPNYMARQVEINERMRAMLIDWLATVHYDFELMEETLFLTVNLIDRFLERETVVQKKLQLVGMTSMLLACKFGDVSIPPPGIFVDISANLYTRNDIMDMERSMLKTLQFNIYVPTPYMFLRRFLKAARANQTLEHLSLYIAELCLVEYEVLKFPPSLLAAAAVYTAQCSINRFKQWNNTMEWHAKYSEDDLLECSKMMVSFHQKAGSGRFTGIYRKYSTPGFGDTARAEPAYFLLDL